MSKYMNYVVKHQHPLVRLTSFPRSDTYDLKKILHLNASETKAHFISQKCTSDPLFKG